MSNLSTLPKGDSAWLLRKAIERIIDQVSVLETNIGVSTSGNSANTQIIFNDDGTLRGDAGLVYNKTTDALTVAGLVTAGSATITGDLTVRTNKLKVDSTGVAIGATSAAYLLDVRGTDTTFGFFSGLTKAVRFVGSASTSKIEGVDNTNASYQPLSIGGSALDFSLSGTTAMTLNSTGLGVGVSPTQKLSVNGAVDFKAYVAHMDNFAVYAHTSDGTIVSSFTGYPICFRIANSEKARIDTSGNVGIGVTPSAWSSSYRAIEIGRTGNAFWGQVGVSGVFMSSNALLNTSSAFVYSNTAASTYYTQNTGRHEWYNAPSGTAGNAITFTQAMTLDASGNLSVGTTNAGGVFGSVRSGFVATGASGAIGAKVDATGRACLIAWNADTSGDNNFTQFFTEATLTTRGSITYNRAGGLVAYNVTSDYRSKDIIGPVSNSGSLIDSLKVYLGKIKGATIARPMLIAHEAQEIAPYSVTGIKDEVDADGKDKYQQMDVSSFVPLLIAEIQSLRARVQTLEAK